MRALSLYQPWASLLALGYKRLETRSWSTSYRGPIAVHASKRRLPLYWFGELLPLLRELHLDPASLPYGAMLATGRLAEVYPADLVRLTARERLLGDFSDGRYAWYFTDLVLLEPVVPVLGKRLLWDWDAPES